MKDYITPRIKDAWISILTVRFFLVILESVNVFLLFSIPATLLDLDLYLALIPACVYLLVKWFKVVRSEEAVKQITLKYPSLNQRLQTAYDNRYQKNIIVENLLLDVSRKLDEIYLSSFIDKKAFIVTTFTTIFLVHSLLAAHFFHVKDAGMKIQEDLLREGFNLFDAMSGGGGSGKERITIGGGGNWEVNRNYTNKDEPEKIGGEGRGRRPGFDEGFIPGQGGGVGSNSDNEIYGEPTSVKVEGSNVKMEVHPEYGGEIEFKEYAAAEGREKNTYKTPEKIEAVEKPETEPVKYEEIIKTYWEKLVKTEGVV